MDHHPNLANVDNNILSNRINLWKEVIEPWKTFGEQQNTGVHVGEFGVYKKEPSSGSDLDERLPGQLASSRVGMGAM